MVLVEDLADLRQGQIGDGADEIDGDLPGQDDVLVAGAAQNRLGVDGVVFCRLFNDDFGRVNIFIPGPDQSLNCPGGVLLVDVLPHEIPIGQQPLDGALQLPDVGGDVLGDVFH